MKSSNAANNMKRLFGTSILLLVALSITEAVRAGAGSHEAGASSPTQTTPVGVHQLRKAEQLVSPPADFAFGADLSFLESLEARGKVFKDGNTAMPGLEMFRNHGYNWIRLRLFVEPVAQHLPNDLSYTLAEAKAAKKLGYRFLLDLHYANSWADPGKQPTPKAWRSLSHAERVQKVFEYTRDTIAAFREAGVLPDMVQIGNEVTHGMLWPDGRLPAPYPKVQTGVFHLTWEKAGWEAADYAVSIRDRGRAPSGMNRVPPHIYMCNQSDSSFSRLRRCRARRT
jgi:Glycosyl hydrolase family 53